jgi:capsular polysaccharide biosynthesis protein
MIFGSVLLSALWRARWALVIAVLAAGAAGTLLSANQAVSYTAASRMVLSASQSFHPLGAQSLTEPTRFISDQASIITTSPVLEGASNELSGAISPAKLARTVSVEASGDNDVMTVSASAPTAVEAADRANAVVSAYRDYVAREVQARATAAAAATNDSAVADRIRTEAAAYDDGVAVVEPAEPPVAASRPAPVRDGLIVAVIAGLITAGVALWRRPQAVEGAPWQGAERPPVLGLVSVRKVGPGQVTAADSTEYTFALVALDYAREGTSGPVFLTGTRRDSRAPAVALGFAVAAAARGRRVLLIDADPESQALLALTRESGATTPRRDLDAPPGPGASNSQALAPLPGHPDVSLATLGSSGAADEVPVRHALEQGTADFDLVLVQVGPLSASPYAFSLVRLAGSVVAVVDESESPRALAVLGDRLATAQRRLAGLVLTRRTRRGFPWPTGSPSLRRRRPQRPRHRAAETIGSLDPALEPPVAGPSLPAHGPPSRSSVTPAVLLASHQGEGSARVASG